MAVDLLALKTELNTDPQSYGYAPLVAIGNDSGLSDVVNFTRNGTTPCPVNGVVGPAVVVKRSDVPPGEILEAIDVRDLLAAPPGVVSVPLTQSWLESITQFATVRLANSDGSKTLVRKNIDRITGDTQGSQTRLDAVAVRSGSRAESLFGQGVVVTAAQVGDALRRT